MANNSQEPRKFDAVFGGQVPPPVNGAVNGGIKGLHQRFASLNEQVRLETVANASNYGDERIDILVRALKDPSLQIRVKAYQILKQSNKAESETRLGIRLNIGDKIYCVYRSALSYGDDWYYFIDSIDDDEDEDEYDEEDEWNEDEDKFQFYKPLSDDDEDGYLHYITDARERCEMNGILYHLVHSHDKPDLNSLHMDIDKAETTAKCLHRQQLLQLDEELGHIYIQYDHENEVLSQWCQDNNVSIKCNENEYAWDFQARIFKKLQKSSDIDLLNRYWEFILPKSRRLAFVHECIIDRKCYLQGSLLNIQQS